jgi:hypothetical protein
MSMIDTATVIFNEHYPAESRKQIIQRFVDAGMTPAGASTYYQKLKKASDPDNVASAPTKHVSKLPRHIQVIRERTKWKGYGDEINHIYFIRDGKMIAYVMNDGTVHNTTKPMLFDKRGREFDDVKNHKYGLDDDSNIVEMS